MLSFNNAVFSYPPLNHALDISDGSESGQCCIFFFHVSLQAYVYKRGTDAATIFDKQTCVEHDLESRIE